MDTTIYRFANPDKDKRESKKYNPLEFPYPSRIFIFGRPDSSKTNIAHNIVVRLDPEPDKIVVIHNDPDSLEYDSYKNIADDYTFIAMNDPEFEVPSFKEFDGNKKNLIIIDDLPMGLLNKENKILMERLFNYASTHRQCTIILVYQNFHNVLPEIRRSMTHYILTGTNDYTSLNIIANKIATKVDDLIELMSFLTNKYDSLLIDTTKSPGDTYKYRLNLFNPITEIT